MKQPIFYQHPAARKRFFAALLSLALSLPAGSVYAVTCSVNSNGVSFGEYDVFSISANDATGDISVTCSDVAPFSVSYTILLSTGGGSYASRAMTSGSHQLTYNLYTDPARSVVWGDGSGGTGMGSDSYSSGVLTETRHYSVYGRIPAQQNAYVGSYSDNITVTVNY